MSINGIKDTTHGSTISLDGIKDTIHRNSDVADEPCTVLAPIEGFSKQPLTTLEDATKPLQKIVPRIDTYVHVAKERAKKPSDNLSVDESAAIALYTMEWHPYIESVYYILNATLRMEDRQQIKPWFFYLKLLFTALSRLPSISLTVYRGVRGEIDDIQEKYQEGKQVIWWGFSSCSKIQDISEKDQFLGQTGRRTLFIIKCMKGKDIGKHSYFKKEKEILLLPATRVQVTKYDYQVDGLLKVYLEEIKSPYPLLESLSSENEIKNPRSLSISSNSSLPPKAPAAEPERRYNAKLNEYIARCKPRSEAYLIGKRFDDYDMEVIVRQLIIEKQCRQLFLRESKVTSQGAILISQALRNNNTLEHLFISENQIGDTGTKAFAEALSDNNNSFLKQLCLGKNGITDVGVDHLATMLESNKTLTHLWLASNQISDRGLQRLVGVLMNSNRTLQVLSLEWNKFRDAASVELLVNLLKQNQTLTTLNLESCKLSSSAVKELKSAAKIKKNFNLAVR